MKMNKTYMRKNEITLTAAQKALLRKIDGKEAYDFDGRNLRPFRRLGLITGKSVVKVTKTGKKALAAA